MLVDPAAIKTSVAAAFEKAGLPGVCELVVQLLAAQETRHQAEIAKLAAKIEQLEKRLNKNSSNSGKPPSSDGLRRTTKSRRKKSGRKPGGQKGHQGSTLCQREDPDKVVHLPLECCPNCHGDLSDEKSLETQNRQTFDLPAFRLLVTEFRAEQKCCPHCQEKVGAGFPHGVNAPAQYGPRLCAFVTYLNIRHVIPVERIAELVGDLTQQRPSGGSVHNMIARCAELLETPVEEIREALREAGVLHADETGIRCDGKTQWLHTVGNQEGTIYSLGPKRGLEGFESGGVLKEFSGTLVHDFWGAYDSLECDHARCNAHLDRELISCMESGHEWAGDLRGVLYEMKDLADHARSLQQSEVPGWQRKRLRKRYRKIIAAALKEHPPRSRPPDCRKRGRVAQSVETNLLLRLRDHEDEVLRFFDDLAVPFDNNQAERDIRMVKVQQKVSGCFRTLSGTESYCTIKSFVSTVRKQGGAVMESLHDAFAGFSVQFGT